MMNNNYYGSQYNPYQTQQMQQQYFPLAVVNTKEEMERFIVQPNGAVFLYSEQLKLLCIKRADNIGRFSYEVYSLTQDNNNAQNGSKYVSQADFITLSNKVDELYKKLGVGLNDEQPK